VQTKAGNPPKCDTLCQDATRAQNDALTAENAFNDAHDAHDTLGQLAVAQAFLSIPIAQITKLTLEELSQAVVFQLLLGAIAGVGGERLMGYAIFKWEASQSLNWFRQKGNVRCLLYVGSGDSGGCQRHSGPSRSDWIRG